MSNASITVLVNRETIDAQGELSDGDVESCADYVLAEVRHAFLGVEARRVLSGGRTSGVGIDGTDFTPALRKVVQRAMTEWVESLR